MQRLAETDEGHTSRWRVKQSQRGTTAKRATSEERTKFWRKGKKPYDHIRVDKGQNELK